MRVLLGELEEIIRTRNIQTVFQPIVNTKAATVIGYEALSRGPQGSLLASPEALFTAAKEHGLLWELESLCRSRAFENAQAHGHRGYLFINVDPQVLKDANFRTGLTSKLVGEYQFHPSQIVFEVTEKSSIADYPAFRETLRHYTQQG